MMAINKLIRSIFMKTWKEAFVFFCRQIGNGLGFSETSTAKKTDAKSCYFFLFSGVGGKETKLQKHPNPNPIQFLLRSSQAPKKKLIIAINRHLPKKNVKSANWKKTSSPTGLNLSEQKGCKQTELRRSSKPKWQRTSSFPSVAWLGNLVGSRWGRGKRESPSLVSVKHRSFTWKYDFSFSGGPYCGCIPAGPYIH